jgi:hypothetical protein
MRYEGIYETLRQQFEARYGEPVEAQVLVHRSPDQPGARGAGRLLRRGPATAMGINNHLCLTPTSIRLAALGGRSGVKPKDDILAWSRATVAVQAIDAERHAFFASYGSSYDYEVHALRIDGPEGDLIVDVMQENHLADPAPDIRRLLEACAPHPEELR